MPAPRHRGRSRLSAPRGRLTLGFRLLIPLVGWLLAAEARAQLAITEAMSWASTNCVDCAILPRGCHPDFFELTNFGTNHIDLSGYLFVDRDGPFPGGAWPIPDGVSIRPGESIVFVRSWPEVSQPAQFREWWGDANLPADLQIIFYPVNYGFDGLGDAVRIRDAQSNMVDQVYFGETRRGVTFAYDTNSGAATPSVLDVGGAFAAANCGDIGSPGWAPDGPVPLRITRQPVDQTVDAGSDVTFQVEATGLPRPLFFQWYRNGAPLPKAPPAPDAVPLAVDYAGCGVAWKISPKPVDLVVVNVQPAHAGEYYVVFGNGLERSTSAVVTLTVNTTPRPPWVDCPSAEFFFLAPAGGSQTNLVVSPFQTAMFEVIARGYPAPTCRWSWSGNGATFTDLPGATNRSLMVSPVLSGHAGIYRVRLQNALGTNYAYASLTVKDKPRLKITEVMSDSCYVNEDWWELTNVGDEPVDLYGYRWDDHPGVIGGGPTVTNSVVVEPGESVIFLEGRTPEFFREWWGADNLPPGLQFIRHTANGLEPDGDELTLWNPTATDSVDSVDSVSFASSFAASFWYAPDDPCSEFGVSSVAGECGAFLAAQGCDVGSPGWTPWTPPRLTSLRREGATVRLEWKAQPGSSNLVQYTDNLAGPRGGAAWSPLGGYRFSGAKGEATDATVGATGQRFYRVIRAAPAGCECPESPFP